MACLPFYILVVAEIMAVTEVAEVVVDLVEVVVEEEDLVVEVVVEVDLVVEEVDLVVEVEVEVVEDPEVAVVEEVEVAVVEEVEVAVVEDLEVAVVEDLEVAVVEDLEVAVVEMDLEAVPTVEMDLEEAVVEMDLEVAVVEMDLEVAVVEMGLEVAVVEMDLEAVPIVEMGLEAVVEVAVQETMPQQQVPKVAGTSSEYDSLYHSFHSQLILFIHICLSYLLSGGGVPSGAEHSRNANEPARKGALVLVGAAAVAGAAMAMAAYRKRTVVTKSHPLNGAVGRRMNLFSNMAGHHRNAARPDRLAEIQVDDNYHHADEIQMV